MAWSTDAWGLGGWIVVALLPLSFWAFIVFVLILVFRRSATVQLPLPEAQTSPEPVRESASEPSALGWFPPVAPHH